MYINESVNNDTKTDPSLNDQAISVILKAGIACFKIRATTIRKKSISNFYLTGSAGSKLDSRVVAVDQTGNSTGIILP